MYFTLKGVRYALFKDRVIDEMKGVHPELIHKYYVIVNRRRYPIKQVLGVCLELGRSEFGTVDAGPILVRLGFQLHWFGQKR